MTPFQLEIDSLGGVVTLHLIGELDASSAPTVRDAVVRLISEGRAHLVFDCEQLAFIDSTGLGVLVGARARGQAANGSVALSGVKPALQRLLTVTGIDSLFLTAA